MRPRSRNWSRPSSRAARLRLQSSQSRNPRAIFWPRCARAPGSRRLGRSASRRRGWKAPGQRRPRERRRAEPMALEQYRAKRDFSVTPEPKPKAPRKSTAGYSFVVQKHAARRLHYDLRLELDGVMKSWAVTRGPSLVPGEKRLAVQVEDHPVEYSKFEGTIPQGEYGGGTVMIWDRGSWAPENDPYKGLAKGHLSFTLTGEKLHGGWHLVRLHRRPGEK